MTRALLDTSVLISGLSPEMLAGGGTAAVSVVSLGELVAGVQLARDDQERAQRQARLAAVRQAFIPLPVDEPIAERYGHILAAARADGRITKATDLLIIATADAAGRTLHTRDESQASLAHFVGVPVVA